MTVATILLSLFALALGAVGGFSVGRLTRPAREPETDTEHADYVNAKGRELNVALHNARAAGLNPAIRIAPVDVEKPAADRPLLVTVERGGETITRSVR